MFYVNNPDKLPDPDPARRSIFLPKDLPIVLKHVEHLERKSRFQRTLLVREICTRNNYQALIVPRVSVCDVFLVESRLPIITGLTESMLVYITNQKCFTRAAEEFTKFLCQVDSKDLLCGNCPRYDNAALYLEEGQGKIGLIDSECCDPASETEDYYKACSIAVHFFPYHLDAIINAAKAFDPDIESKRIDLEREKDSALDFFTQCLQNYTTFNKDDGTISKEDLAKAVQRFALSGQLPVIQALLSEGRTLSLEAFKEAEKLSNPTTHAWLQENKERISPGSS
jgi:hypothetical protein